MVAKDFSDLDGAKVSSPWLPTKSDNDKKREYLKAFETLGPQLLNAYGPAKFPKLSDEQVWKDMSKPLKSGAPCMTELCLASAERRGVGINRWLLSMKLFCEYQNDPEIKKQNEYLLQKKLYNELYAEIERILPSLEYCLAPKKVKEKSGAAFLRSSSMLADEAPSIRKDPQELDRHAKNLYEWLDLESRSRVRMLANWQSAGGMSFIAAVYHRGTQCFRYEGNSLHGSNGTRGVTLTEFQESIKERHRIGDTGMDPHEPNGGRMARDFS